MADRTTIETYDTVIIGSGEGGKLLGWTLASAGRKTAVVERRWIGGACPNIACLPSKNVVYSAKITELMRRHDEFGLSGVALSIDMPAIRGRKRRMVDDLVEMHLEKFRKSGAELIEGNAKLLEKHRIEVTLQDGRRRVLRCRNLVLGLGSRATIDPVPGLREAEPLTHIEMLEIDVVPAHLIVLGGGYVGLEFAQAFARFGSRVTIVERNDRLLHHEDVDVSDAVSAVFAKEKVESATRFVVERVEGRSGERVVLHGSRGGVPVKIEGSHLLVATGRTPNTDGVGLEETGIARTQRGHIQVDPFLRTTSPRTWAVGDCAGSPHFTHVGYDDFRVVKDQLLGGGTKSTAGRLVPSCLFIDPELARVGLNETEATKLGIAYRVAKVPMKSALRTWTMNEQTGFLKALIGDDDRVLGFTGFGAGAGEILATVQLAMSAGLAYPQLRDLIITHPTLAEGLVSLFSAVPAK